MRRSDGREREEALGSFRECNFRLERPPPRESNFLSTLSSLKSNRSEIISAKWVIAKSQINRLDSFCFSVIYFRIFRRRSRARSRLHAYIHLIRTIILFNISTLLHIAIYQIPLMSLIEFFLFVTRRLTFTNKYNSILALLLINNIYRILQYFYSIIRYYTIFLQYFLHKTR